MRLSLLTTVLILTLATAAQAGTATVGFIWDTQIKLPPQAPSGATKSSRTAEQE